MKFNFHSLEAGTYIFMPVAMDFGGINTTHLINVTTNIYNPAESELRLANALNVQYGEMASLNLFTSYLPPSWNITHYEFDLDFDPAKVTFSDVQTAETLSAIMLAPLLAAGEEFPTPKLNIAIHPNPFRQCASISLDKMDSAPVTLEIYNLKGQKVYTLYDGNLAAGSYSFSWQGCDDSGAALSSGIYFIKAYSGNRTKITKLTLIKEESISDKQKTRLQGRVIHWLGWKDLNPHIRIQSPLSYH